MYREEIRYTFTTYIYFAVNSVINHGNKGKRLQGKTRNQKLCNSWTKLLKLTTRILMEVVQWHSLILFIAVTTSLQEGFL